ncbi:uncharacterized protein LOC111921540 [Lactuca sativa]|uniref:uncharacterized protein LOC111921540 n=1 Tax=Lactuca sativa TaxID=4236 RepID=UPI000CD929B1|nr:uncharacterized protein LOC111921540 [Lactuca sativa]
MANGKTGSTKDIYVGCEITLSKHTFEINLMPVNIRSFCVFIGIDWLSPHHADIKCHEKAVCLHLPNHETLIICRDKPDANLRLIPRIRAQKCSQMKNDTFFSHVEDKTKEEASIQNIPVACDFPDVFSEEFPGIPPERQIEFRIYLVPGATPITKSPYRLAPTVMQ